MIDKPKYENGYQVSLLVFSLVATLPFGFMIVGGIAKSSWSQLGFGVLFLFATWLIYSGVKHRNIIAIWLSIVMATILWLVLLFQTGNRILFVIENGGFERVDGHGSPLAFLLGLFTEQLFFIPLCFVVISGWLYRYNVYITKNNG
jgi:hypothetical protein